jgi:hypothetical protein
MFNRAKALGVLGSVRDADDAYSGVAQSAYGSDLQAGGSVSTLAWEVGNPCRLGDPMSTDRVPQDAP